MHKLWITQSFCSGVPDTKGKKKKSTKKKVQHAHQMDEEDPPDDTSSESEDEAAFNVKPIGKVHTGKDETYDYLKI